MRTGLLLAAIVASVAPAHAFAPRKADRIPARVRPLATAPPGAARDAFAPLAQRGWRASWDRDTGVPTWVWGSYVDVPGAIADAARAEQAARAFLAAHVAVLAPGARAADFVLVANQLDDRLRTVTFQQTWHGLRVVGGQVGFVVARDRLFAIGSAAWPNVSPGPVGRADAASQAARAEAWLAGETGMRTRARATGERVIAPIVRGGAIAYHVADVFDAMSLDGPERWDVYVATDGTPLLRTPKVMLGAGTLAYNAGIRHAGGPRADFAASTAAITVNGSAAMTAADGAFTWPGPNPATVVPGVTGVYVRVVDQAGAAATDTLNVQSGQTVTWNRASDEFADAQLSTFVYASLAKARARIVNPSAGAWLDTRLDFFVNENGTCNAYSTGNDVHLFRASTTCENTGRVGDVVIHEFGHSFHNNSIIGGMGAFDSHLSEGLSDFFTADLTGDPAMGRGFFKSDEPLRHIDPVGHERVYPIDFDFDPHVSGLIISGALWDLRKALVAELGSAAGIARTQAVFTGIMQRANDISTTFMAALIADDDDGNLGNGTPSYCAIERAFGMHGLVPDYETTRVAPPEVNGLALSVTVTTPIETRCPPPVVTDMTVTWRANDGVPSELALVPTGATWTGAFPEQPAGVVLSYSVDVRFDDGTIRSFPDNPADPRYQLFTGGATPIWCEPFDADPGWAQTSTAGFEWEWGTVKDDPTSPDPDVAVTGTGVLGTDVSGDGLYRPELITSIRTPALDVSAFETVRLQYWRWLTIEDALYDKATIVANGTEVWRNAVSQSGTTDHVDREWRFHDIDLTPHVRDGNVAIDWTLTSDFGKELGGWTLDDVCVVGLVKLPRCGDGELDVGEQCDDGNADSDDGCSASCIDEVTAGGGGCCSSSGGSGSLVLALGVLACLCGQRRRRASSLPPSRSVSLRMP